MSKIEEIYTEKRYNEYRKLKEEQRKKISIEHDENKKKIKFCPLCGSNLIKIKACTHWLDDLTYFTYEITCKKCNIISELYKECEFLDIYKLL
ncbi:hypothetical protein LCGC14_1721880 [marine sediment metagenome]|uniref:Uncharacterized protein n=1 Tax=marine sediment metagenome TaxID=412755 RepID=A0A0F9JSL4_9ZZZZ